MQQSSKKTQKLFQEFKNLKLKLFETQLKIITNSFCDYIKKTKIDLFDTKEIFNCDDFEYDLQKIDQAGIVANSCKSYLKFSSKKTIIEYYFEFEYCNKGDFLLQKIKINNKCVYVKHEFYGDYYEECFEEYCEEKSNYNDSDDSLKNINKLGKNEILIDYFHIANELLKKCLYF